MRRGIFLAGRAVFGARFWEPQASGPDAWSRRLVPTPGPHAWSPRQVPTSGPHVGLPRLVSAAAAGARFRPSPGHVRTLAPMCAERLPSRKKRAGFQSVPETGAGAAGAAALTSGRWVGPATQAVELGTSRSTAAASGSAGRRPDSRRLARRRSKRLESSAAALPSGHQCCWGMPGPVGAVGWAGGRRAASLSRAPNNRAVCSWVAAHTPRAGVAWAHGFSAAQAILLYGTPRVWAAAPSPGHPAAAGGLFGSEGAVRLGRRAPGDGAWGT